MNTSLNDVLAARTCFAIVSKGNTPSSFWHASWAATRRNEGLRVPLQVDYRATHCILSQFQDTHVLRAIADIGGISHAMPILRVYITDNPKVCLYYLHACRIDVFFEILNKKMEQRADKIKFIDRHGIWLI